HLPTGRQLNSINPVQLQARTAVLHLEFFVFFRAAVRMTSERILFVDDDPVARNAFSRTMRQRGFLIDVARDGAEAWQLASQFPYAVVVTDLRMPGIDGLKLVEQLKELER